MSSNIAFLIKCDKIHVKNTEKPTFLILNDYSILRTALPKSHVNLLNFEHLLNQRTKKTLWFLRDTYPKCSDWCEQHTILYANVVLFILKKKKLKNSFCQLFVNWQLQSIVLAPIVRRSINAIHFHVMSTSLSRHEHVLLKCILSS